MTVASSKAVAKRRMDAFLWDDKSPTNKLLRSLLVTEFCQFDRLAVVGGMVRDMTRAGRQGFRSDVDLVLEAPAGIVIHFAERHGAIPNSFGGYSMRAGVWKVDFWSLETTWASRAGHVQVRSMEDVTRCTFFDWDAVIYDVKERKVHCAPGYIERLRSGVMDIALAPNPSIVGNLFRAARRLLLWNLRPGNRLEAFIEEHLDEESFDRLRQFEKEQGLGSLFAWFKNADELRGQLMSRHRHAALAEPRLRQMHLPLRPLT